MRVLTLSRNYPNDALPHLGLWVEGLVKHIAQLCQVRVVSPVPYAPPLPKFAAKYTRFRRVPKQEQRNGIEVWHPRFLTGPGYSVYRFEAGLYYQGVRGAVARLRREFPFDLIHAHFGYPDGAVAARLAREYGVPLVITEHAVWHPWMDDYPGARAQAVEAARQAAFHIAGSRALRDSIADFTKLPEKICLIPIGTDTTIFKPDGRTPKPNQIVYVGRFQHVKGVDVLLRGMRLLVDRRPEARLVLVGGSFYGSQEDQQTRALAGELKLEANVEFAGVKTPSEVADIIRDSAVLALASRRESFGTVLIEALACGRPVVATRCGGPEDIVTDEVGQLVPKEDPARLAEALNEVLSHPERHDPARLAKYADERYSWRAVARQVVGIYEEAAAKER